MSIAYKENSMTKFEYDPKFVDPERVCSRINNAVANAIAEKSHELAQDLIAHGGGDLAEKLKQTLWFRYKEDEDPEYWVDCTDIAVISAWFDDMGYAYVLGGDVVDPDDKDHWWFQGCDEIDEDILVSGVDPDDHSDYEWRSHQQFLHPDDHGDYTNNFWEGDDESPA